MTVDQEGFRWRNDDGSETSATWLAAQDTDASIAVDGKVRLRVLLDAAGDPDPAAYTLYYKKTTDSVWVPVPVGAGGGDPIYVAASTNITASGEATTALLTPPSGKTTGAFTVGRMWDDENGTDLIDLGVTLTAPGAPTGVSGTAGDTEVDLTWTAPVSDGGSAITDYVVQWALESSPTTWTTFSEATSTATSTTVTGLTNGTAYVFHVAAVNAIGTGSYSSTSTAVTPTGAGAPFTDSFDGTGALSGTGNWDNLNATDPARVSGELVSGTGVEFNFIIWQTACSTLNQFAEVRFDCTTFNKAQIAVVRNSNTFAFFGASCYCFEAHYYDSWIYLKKFTPGAESQIDSYNVGSAPTGYHTYRIEVEDLGGGSHEIRGFFDGDEVMSAVDSTSPLTGMYVGISGGFPGGSGVAKWDDFQGGDL